MHDERTLSAVDAEEAQMDAAVLALLLDDDAQRPWADAEVCLAVGDNVAGTDALDRLHAAGLIHRVSGFVWATRPALRSAQIEA